MTPARTFPIRLAPLPGEALDSWLEALASRLHVRLGDVLDELGIETRARNGVRGAGVPADRTIALRDEEAARIAHATRTSPQQLHDMTLMRYDGRGVLVDQERREVRPHALWGRTGSRFCPECLAGNGGRWLLAWRLGWSFACLAHGRLLADCCPGCGCVQRKRPFSRMALPVPGRCGIRPSRFADAEAPSGCGQDLSEARTLRLPAGHPALAAQRLVFEVIESGAGYGVYGSLPQPAAAVLTDVRALARKILADVPAGDLPGWVPQDIADAHAGPDLGRETSRRKLARPGFMAPERAVTTAVAVTAACRVLGEPTVQRAGTVMRELVEAVRSERTDVAPGSISRWGGGTSPVLGAVYLAALGPSLQPAEQLRCRTADSMPVLPSAGKSQASRRARKMPAALWPSWAVRLSPPDRAYYRTLGPALSCMVLLAGVRRQSMDLDEAAALLGQVTDGPAVSRMLILLADDARWDGIAAAVARLAGYLDGNDVPIDYQRRRRLDYADLLTPQQWAGLCRRTGTGPGHGEREKMARCLLFARVSGLPLESARDFDTDDDPTYFRAQTYRFAALRTPELAAALDDAARDFLARNGVRDEPLTWQPPPGLLGGLGLPGPDPCLIDVPRLHELVRNGARPSQHTAEILGTSADAVRLVLDEHPAPAAPLTDAQYRAAGMMVLAARQQLTEPEFRRRYDAENQSLADIGKQTGLTMNILRRLAAEYGIAMRRKPMGVVDREWLLEQYVARGRALADLAREKNISPGSMSRWARYHQIPLRPPGSASRDLLRYSEDQAACLPDPASRALTGPYAYALQRLNRFAAAAGHPSLTRAAEHLGIHQASLTVQVNRLERDIGGPLLERPRCGHEQMALTPLGEQVLAAVHQASEAIPPDGPQRPRELPSPASSGTPESPDPDASTAGRLQDRPAAPWAVWQQPTTQRK